MVYGGEILTVLLQLVGAFKEPLEEDKIYVVAMGLHYKNAIEVCR